MFFHFLSASLLPVYGCFGTFLAALLVKLTIESVSAEKRPELPEVLLMIRKTSVSSNTDLWMCWEDQVFGCSVIANFKENMNTDHPNQKEISGA